VFVYALLRAVAVKIRVNRFPTFVSMTGTLPLFSVLVFMCLNRPRRKAATPSQYHVENRPAGASQRANRTSMFP